MFDTTMFKSSESSHFNEDVIFVADLFAEDYVGGAELTSDALITSSPYSVRKLHCRDLTPSLLQKNADKFWIFGNFATLDPKLFPNIIGKLRYSVLEYDYKYCTYRSPEKHKAASSLPCDCHKTNHGMTIATFFAAATMIWWMSEAQKARYINKFPFLGQKDSTILSSVFSTKTLEYIKSLRGCAKSDTWIVLGSNSWVKGATAAIEWCKKNHKRYEVIWGLSYRDTLQKLASAEGFVYLPEGADTCPRMVIEAKLLGCELVLNDNVQHANEAWFSSTETTLEHLTSATSVFWNTIKKMIDYVPTISGYTTSYNCLSRDYPIKQCIQSMLEFCDEVCVVDGGSDDGTWDLLTQLSHADSRIRTKQVPRDWNHPRHAVFDGMQKAEARKMCTGDFCWQMDSDEIVHEDDATKIRNMCHLMPNTVDIVSLPVIEYWGSIKKVRVDIQPWKWRLSRNKPEITHGIPRQFRTYDDKGNLMASPGTDGCDMIDANTGDVLPHVSFYTFEIDQLRQRALQNDVDALECYKTWFNNIVTSLPCVFHYSWYDMARKIHLYRDYWQTHWACLVGNDVEDRPENNMFFDVKWSDVTDEMIDARAKEITEKLGGWIWHAKWDGVTTTPHISCHRSQPMFVDFIRADDK